MTDHDELFDLHQLFFTGEYSKVVELNNAEYSQQNQKLVSYYKVRSLISLGKFNEIDSVIGGNEDVVYKVLQAYGKLLSKGIKEDAKFEELISNNANEDSIINRLGALYFIKLNEFEKAIQILDFKESLEKSLFLVEIHLILNDLNKAEIIFKNSNNSNDEIILNFAENLINSVKNGENLRSVLYFFEELAHQHPTLLTLLGLFVVNLQLNQVPEAEIALNQLIDAGYKDADLLANQIAYYQLKNNEANAELKRKELIELNSKHPSVLDYTAKNELFDSIVEKYKEQVN